MNRIISRVKQHLYMFYRGIQINHMAKSVSKNNTIQLNGKRECTSKSNVWRPEDVFVSNPCGNYALIVLNRPIQLEPNTMKQLWTNASLRILVDGGANRWLYYTDKYYKNSELMPPDLLTGDFDSITPESMARFESLNIEIIHTADQDETDFTKSLIEMKRTALEKNIKIDYVTAIVETSGRLDHIMASFSLSWLLNVGHHTIYVPSLLLEQQLPCGLIPIDGSSRVTTTGLKWNLVDTEMKFGQMVSSSNTYSSNKLTINTDGNILWTMTISNDQSYKCVE